MHKTLVKYNLCGYIEVHIHGNQMAKVLIIDDDASVRDIIHLSLALKDHEVFEASNGYEGIEKIHIHNLDIIITDLFMSDVEGIEVIMELRKNKSQTPIIVISAGGRYQDALSLNMAKTLGANATLAKPFELTELSNLVDKL